MGNDSEPLIPPLYDGDENASPTGSLRTVRGAQEQARGPVATVGSGMLV